MTQSTVLILGARGRFGLAAARAFADAGWRVVAHMRPGAVAPTSRPGIEWIHADLNDTQTLAAAAKEASVVVHALNPAYTHKAWLNSAMSMPAKLSLVNSCTTTVWPRKVSFLPTERASSHICTLRAT